MHLQTMLSEEWSTTNRQQRFWKRNTEQKHVSITSLKNYLYCLLQILYFLWENQSFQQLILLVLWTKIGFFCVAKEKINRIDLSRYEMRIMLEEKLTGK